MKARYVRRLFVALELVTSSSVLAQSEDQATADLAKQLQNPVANLISVPFQNNVDFYLGPNDNGVRYLLNFQPVIPFSLNKDWNLITRTIVPIIDQKDVIAPNTSEGGLGDITQSFFFSPKQPVAGLIIGAGPVFLYPSATDSLLGSEKVGAGPTLVVLKQEGPWTVGLLFNHIWSFAGDEHRTYVSSTFLQPFISYTTKTQTLRRFSLPVANLQQCSRPPMQSERNCEQNSIQLFG